jgi:hypothetical protein
MTERDATPAADDWSSEDRRSIVWLAALPAVGSAIFTLAMFLTKPTIWLVAFIATSMGAYATAFLGVMPILLVFRRRRWTRLLHYAVAGFAGVLLPWFVVGACTEFISRGSVQASVNEGLFLAASIGAALTTVFGWRSRRDA